MKDLEIDEVVDALASAERRVQKVEGGDIIIEADGKVNNLGNIIQNNGQWVKSIK